MNQFLKGTKDGFPIAIGYLPIALTFGILSVQAGLTPIQATGMSVWVFAGASQFIAVNLLQSHVLISEIILTTFILNLRHLLMSTSLSRKLNTNPFTSSLLSFGITDETFVVASVHQEETIITSSYFLGLALMAYSGWVFGTLLGSLFSNLIPGEWATGMSIALYSMFIGLLVPSMKKSWQISFIAILGGFFSWGFTAIFPLLSNGWVIILATFVATTIGSLLPNQEVKSS
ncbi:AzlC family ABC transporter permease [Tepidibacillus marianensis]|uniref:AzlC family ABC transporter permease n=1 Tax=Tepidibacillus marianensis TaxID=3131995 RepID=UPI0030CFF71A